jgi:hypothetical protein
VYAGVNNKNDFKLFESMENITPVTLNMSDIYSMAIVLPPPPPSTAPDMTGDEPSRKGGEGGGDAPTFLFRCSPLDQENDEI